MLSDGVSAWLLLNNANTDSSQPIILCDVADTSPAGLSPHSLTDECISAVSFEAVASIVSLQDTPPVSSSDLISIAVGHLASMYAFHPRHDGNRLARHGRIPPRKQLHCRQGPASKN